MKPGRIAVVLLVAGLVGAFFAFDLGRELSFAAIKARQLELAALYQSNPVAVVAAYFAAYVAIAGLSIPGAALVTLLGGALFGTFTGTIIVSFASSLGATLAFLMARYVLGESVQQRFASSLRAINEGVARDGPFYLFTLRMIPAVPFFVVNLAFGLTKMRAATFYWVSQIGMLLGTVVYVNAGTQLAKLESASGILSPGLLGAFVLLGLFPLAATRITAVLRARRVYAPWAALRPARFERNLVVIGAGSAGLVSAYIAAATRAKVTLVEKHRMGGDCLNTGCVPSKALIKSARMLAGFARAGEYGLKAVPAEADFAAVMERVSRVVSAIEPHDSVERYTKLGVECLQGEARITSPWTVEVTQADGSRRVLTTRNIIIAAGARPFVPPIPGIEQVGCLTSDTVWSLRERPKRLLVLGGGPIGSELAQAFARLGSQVTQVEMAPRLLVREDPEVSEAVMAAFRAGGIAVLTGHRARAFRIQDGEKQLLADRLDADGKPVEEVVVGFDALLCAVGRVANTAGYGLEELGIANTAARTVQADEFLQTRLSNIYACGDVVGPYQFTHVAAHQAWYAAVNALFGGLKRFRADYSVIPWATFTDPEVARVGLSESEARERGIAVQVTRYGIDDLDRAIAEGEAHGMVKVLTAPGSDRILGVTIVGEGAGELIAEFVLAMRHGLGLNKILGTIHIYPTMSEANKYAAGVWKRAGVTRGQWAVLDAWQAWTRGEGSLAGVLAALPGLLTDRRPAYPVEAH